MLGMQDSLTFMVPDGLFSTGEQAAGFFNKGSFSPLACMHICTPARDPKQVQSFPNS